MRDIDRCAQTNHWRHHAAGEKLLFAFGMMLVSLTAAGAWGQVAILVAMLALTIFGARVRLVDIARGGRVPLLFILAGTLAQSLSVSMQDGWPMLSVASPEALANAGLVGLRSCACVAALLFLALTTPLSSILQLLQRIGLNAEISDIAMVMFRILWLLLDCLDNGQKSLSSRLGYTSYRRMLTSNAILMASLLPRVLHRAGRMEIGLAARGYGGQLHFLSAERPASLLRLSLIGFLLLLVSLGLLWFE